ncbi:unnamed protein product [Acanthoscelides obtectus]|uniref:Uncharacterized protein n=1 Tax=Acanthoscelides obtectus TaxID=200917 RepID=A0A9P0PG00_ACAOB|nr:unnamed protein product [Acanthoscelides obtectus]CAK1642352.1 N-alpha-acetyltransferase 16, NatA auxiliary subunit [Acanthoscelides obtectus]
MMQNGRMSLDNNACYIVPENLAPSELKKLRNKQRKAKRKAERESQQAREAQVKRDQHNKSRQQQADAASGGGEPDAPQLDELVPDKLARVEDPLDQAIKFLQPLQRLANDRIETHLMAFEVYYRKKKVLLMLQSLKRAHKVEPRNPRLHSCLVRFYQYVQNVKDSWDPRIEEVVQKETQIYFDGKDAHHLNRDFLESNKDSLRAVFECAKMMVHLNDKNQHEAVSLLVTNVDNNYRDVDIPLCTEILESLRNGDLGQVEDSVIEEYCQLCRARFPCAAAFKPPRQATSDDDSAAQTEGGGDSATPTGEAERSPTNHISDGNEVDQQRN